MPLMSVSPPQAPAARASRTHFDRWAWVYSHSRVLVSLQRRALAELRPTPDDRVLDVACGSGSLVAEIAPHVTRATGLDLAPRMIELARARVSPGAPMDFHVGASDDLPFADGEFTAVVCTTALHHFPDPQGAFDEMARVLAPGGRVVIGDSVRDTVTVRLADALLRRFEAGHVGLQRKRDIEAMLTRAGLRVTASRHHWLRIYALVAAERPAA